MLLTRVLSALKKNGVTVTSGPYGYVATKNGHTLEFRENGAGSGQVCYLTERSPMTDASTDCFCDYYAKTIKSALAVLNAPARPVKEPANA